MAGKCCARVLETVIASVAILRFQGKNFQIRMWITSTLLGILNLDNFVYRVYWGLMYRGNLYNLLVLVL